MTEKKSSATLIVWGLVILLIVIHQDNWLWQNDYLVLGFLPIGLFFHACISVAASAMWFLATKIAWPEDVSEEQPEATGTTK